MCITQVFIKFITSNLFSGILLCITTILALIIANSPLQSLYHNFFEENFGFQLNSYFVGFTIKEWVNDVLMAFFFLLVGLEIKREMLVGELNSFAKSAFPAAAAIGGMIVPGLIYYALNIDTTSSHGFGIPMATDIAFALGVMLMLGKIIPLSLKVFLVTLAVVDDLGAIVVIALFYSDSINMIWLLISTIITVILIICNYLGIKKLSVYLFFGVLLWFAIHASGIHATISAVILAFCIPLKAKQGFYELQSQINSWQTHYEDTKQTQASILLNTNQMQLLHEMEKSLSNSYSPLLKLEHFLQPWSAYFIMPVFAFANAGVTITSNFRFSIDHIFLGIFLGLVVGKPIGIFITTFLCEKLGVAKRPDGISWIYIIGAGMLAGIGFTMSLFVSELAFDIETKKELSKVTILMASLTSCILGSVFLLIYGKINKKS